MQAACGDHAIVVLTGARQVGKSTLLRRAEPFCRWRYCSLDDFDILRQANKDPQALWSGADQLVIDEVQKAPGLLTAVKQAVDTHPGRYRFVLSGSANLLVMKQVSETLAGRAVYFVLDPMTLGESKGQLAGNLLDRALRGQWPEAADEPADPPDPAEVILRGLMPPLLALATPASWVRWWEGYVATYLERDLRQIAQIDALVDYRRLMELLALRSGQLVNQSELGRDARLSQATVHRYLNLLETTHMFQRLPAFGRSRTSRLLKSPKAFWNDAGLAAYLAGYYADHDLRQGRLFGACFETLIHHHLRAITRLMTPAARMYFWRRQNGQEVDFVVEHGRRYLAVEAKLTQRPSFADADGLRLFLKDHPTAAGGLLVHTGRHVTYLDKAIVAIPWTLLTG